MEPVVILKVAKLWAHARVGQSLLVLLPLSIERFGQHFATFQINTIKY